MNRDRDKASILDVLVMLVLTVFFTGMAIASLLSGGLIPTLMLGALALLLIWFLINDLQKGVRPPTRWEWFKAWMIARPVLIGAIGFAFFMGLLSYDRSAIMMDKNTFGMVMVVIALVWAALILYTIWRAPRPRRYMESDAAYKKRIGWQGPDE